VDLTAAPNSFAGFAERRSHARRKVRSITYIKLDNGNGGILLNIGPGGLAFQAVARLSPGQDFALRLKLFDAGETTIEGSTAWLGPTGKEAGVCFKNLPGAAEETIARWMQSEDTGFQPLPPKPAPYSPSIPSMSEVLRAVESDARFPLRDALAAAQAIPSTPPPTALPVQAEGPVPSPSPQGEASDPGAVVLDASLPAPIPAPLVRADATALPAKTSPVPAGPAHPIPTPEPTRSLRFFRAVVDFLRQPVDPPAIFAAAFRRFDRRIRPTLALVLAQFKQRRPMAIAVGGILFAIILAAILITTRPGKIPNDGGSTKLAEPDNTFGQTIPPQPSPVQPPLEPQQPRTPRRPPEISWQTKLKRFFWGAEELPRLEPDQVGISVWTDGTSGFYYCVDSPYFEKVLPGTLAQQGDALQEGYQPRLGTYCRE
jgi:hypothetical protein